MLSVSVRNVLFFSGGFRIIWFVVSNMIKLFARRVVNSLLKLHVTNNKNSSRNFAQSQIFYEFLGNHQNVMRLFQIAWQKLKHTRWELNHVRCVSELSTLSAKLVFFLTLETTNSLTRVPGLFGQPAADRKATLIVCPMSVLSNWTVSVPMIFLRRFCIISGLTFTNRKLEQPYITFDDLSWFCCGQRILRSLPASAESWFMSPAFIDGVLIQITQCAVYSPVT